MEETDAEIKAYAPEGDARLDDLKQWLNDRQINFQVTYIDETNWNASWESNFQPVEIPGKILVRADFHPSQVGYEHEIIITPKMSFGTGHHATTKMMMEAMLEVDFSNKKVFDFGTGTGILAILAEKLGANDVIAIDNDMWSYENALENLTKNSALHIHVSCKDQLKGLGDFDVVLANINKNVLLEQSDQIRSVLRENGVLIISGLLSTDYEDICLKYIPLFGNKIKQYQQGDWIAISFNL
jgi:ribosomal protein L11 methyltransferase